MLKVVKKKVDVNGKKYWNFYIITDSGNSVAIKPAYFEKKDDKGNVIEKSSTFEALAVIAEEVK